jgi:hypothetical protein
MKTKNEQYTCNICDKLYSSAGSLWYHNKKFHIQNINNVNNVKEINVNNVKNKKVNSNKSVTCEFCKRVFNNRPAKSMHKKKCKLNKDNNNNSNNCNNEMKKEIIKLKEEIEKLKNNKLQNINNGVINNTINNFINVNSFGNESVEHFTSKDIKRIAKQCKNALIYIIDFLNFNKDLPENHSFCNTSLEGGYFSVYNRNTGKIEKINKNEFYDKVLNNSINKINDMLIVNEFNNEEKIKDKYVKKLEDTIEYTNNFNNRNSKTYKKNINQLSYNKKDLILSTWNKLNHKLEDSESDSESDSVSIDYLSSSDSD